MTRVVVVGGGFGGVRAALLLANKKGFEVKLISKQSYFEYHAALYRSATGRSPLEVAIPLHDFFRYARNIEVIEDTISGIIKNERRLIGESGSKYEYDFLIFALGNVTEYYAIGGLKDFAYGVKTIHEALKLKRHLHEQLLSAESERNYVVIGAGATGVELSAELTAYLQTIRRKHNITTSFTVDLVEASPRALVAMPKDFSKIVTKRLNKLGVKTLFNTPVKSETLDSIQLPKGPILSHTVIWTAGVANNSFFSQFPAIFKLGKANRVVVDEYLQSDPDIYVIGDSAVTEYSGMAQTALYDARFVVRNLIRQEKGKSLHAYKPRQPIYAIPVGARWAAVLWGRVRIYGRLGWLLRRLADLKLYLTFLPFLKAVTVWRYGFVDEEVCSICK
ncbi:MAG: FAD-dependent oxidoreductase [Candidatus Saccharimonadales bacterium]